MLRKGIFILCVTIMVALFANPAKAQTTRLFPGLDFQMQHKGYWYYDFYPYLAYEITPRVTAGAGWNERAGYNPSFERFIGTQRVNGPRIFSDVYTVHGFYAHVESEWMSFNVLPNFTNDFKPRHREWVWSMQAGVKRKFWISDHFIASALLQYNLVNHYFRTPYVDRVNFRVGVEYRFRP